LVRQQKVFGLVILLTGILINAHQAEAGLRFCNQGTFKLTTAVGYVDRRKGWVAKGWLSLEPGECKDALRFRLDNRYYYYHAVGHDEGAHVRYDGEHPFCIESRHFTVYQANYGKSTDEECAKDGLRSAKFLKIDVEGKPEFTVNLGGPDNPPPGGKEAPNQPPAAAPPPSVQQEPAGRQPPPAAMQQPPSEPPAVSTDPPPPPRRRHQNSQESPPNTPPNQPAVQGGGQDGAACKRYPNLC
jgi:uncharacterized membrane protein